MAASTRNPRKNRSTVKKEANEALSKKSLSQQQKLVDQLEKYRYQIQAKYGVTLEELRSKDMLKGAIKAAKEFGVEVSESLEESSKSTAQKIGEKVGSAVTASLSFVSDLFGQGIEQYFDFFNQSSAVITSHLIGTNKTFQSVENTIKKGVGTSSITSMKDVLNNLGELVKAGISQNIEQRAFLMSVKDRIADSFDALDQTLLQLNRINRNDSTMAYLGMESALQEYFNSSFFDTTYLQGTRDSVSSAIMDATVLMGQKMGAAFEFNVQKWLGAFYSVGASSNTISSIASALGQLGSGNVTQLSSNTQMMALLTSAADRVGLNIGDSLLEGLDASSVNKILYGIYEIATDIKNTQDKVSRQEMASLYGLNSTDIQALAQLSESEIKSILETQMSYDALLSKSAYELTKVADRTTLKTKLDNLIDNVMGMTADGLINGAGGAGYITYTILNMIGSLEVPIPFLGPVDVVNVAKGAIVGMSLLSQIGNIIGGIGNANMLGTTATISKSSGSGYITGVNAKAGQVTTSTNNVSVAGEMTGSNVLEDSLAGTTEESETVSGQTQTEDTTEILQEVRDNTKDATDEIKKLYYLLSTSAIKVEGMDSVKDNTSKMLTNTESLILIRDLLRGLGVSMGVYSVDNNGNGTVLPLEDTNKTPSNSIMQQILSEVAKISDSLTSRMYSINNNEGL